MSLLPGEPDTGRRGRTVTTSASWPMSPPAAPVNDVRMEIRIYLDSVEPPVGRLRVLRCPGFAGGLCGQGELPFTGWLGLLRALNEVTATSGRGPAGPA